MRRAGWLLTAPPDRPNEAEQHYVGSVCAASPALARVHALALECPDIFTVRDANMLTPWLDEAQRSDLHSLAVGLRRDCDAVLAAILFPWSNGQVNRLEIGKADDVRARQLPAAAGPCVSGVSDDS